MKLNSLHSIFFALIFSIFGFSQITQAEESIKIWIAQTAQQNIFKKIKEPFEKKTGIKIVNLRTPDDKNSNMVTYIRDLISEKADAGTNSGSFEDGLAIVRKEAPEISEAQLKEIRFRVIGRDMFNVFAHPTAKIQSLSMAELEKIFSGTATNWKEFGGADLPIKLFYAKSRLTTNKAFLKIVANDKDLSKAAQDVPDNPDILIAVEKTPGAIGYGPTDIKSDKVVLIKTEPIGRPITMFTRGKPSKNVLLLFDFIEKEGKSYGLGK